jgi:hypothetical protein
MLWKKSLNISASQVMKKCKIHRSGNKSNFDAGGSNSAIKLENVIGKIGKLFLEYLKFEFSIIYNNNNIMFSQFPLSTEKYLFISLVDLFMCINCGKVHSFFRV